MNRGTAVVIASTIMADDLLKQVQEFFEGQIVIIPCLMTYGILILHCLLGFRRPETNGTIHHSHLVRYRCKCLEPGVRAHSCFVTLWLRRLQVLAFSLGFAQQNIFTTLWVGLAGTLLTFVMVVPPFPIYREHPQPWLPAGIDLAGGTITVGTRHTS